MKKIIFLFFILAFSCSQNFLQDLSSTDPDLVYYEKALNAVNIEDYDKAITILTTQVSLAGQTFPKMRELLASAHAGKCGLNFIEYTSKLAAQTTGSAMFNLMSPFVQIVVDPASCRTALRTIELIGPTNLRTTNQNIFASITGMVLIGAGLRGYADIAPPLGDGAADINLCTGFTDAQVDDIIIGFGFFNKNFSAVSSSVIGSFSSTNFGDVANLCTAAVGAAACTVTDPANITAPMRDAFRDLINTKEYGIGAYMTGGNPAAVPMSCP